MTDDVRIVELRRHKTVKRFLKATLDENYEMGL